MDAVVVRQSGSDKESAGNDETSAHKVVVDPLLLCLQGRQLFVPKYIASCLLEVCHFDEPNLRQNLTCLCQIAAHLSKASLCCFFEILAPAVARQSTVF